MAAPRVDRRLAAITAMDVVGYSRLIGADEAGLVMARLRGDGEMTMVLVEQRTDVGSARRAGVLMERGRVMFDGTSARLQAEPDVLHALVGVG